VRRYKSFHLVARNLAAVRLVVLKVLDDKVEGPTVVAASTVRR